MVGIGHYKVMGVRLAWFYEDFSKKDINLATVGLPCAKSTCSILYHNTGLKMWAILRYFFTKIFDYISGMFYCFLNKCWMTFFLISSIFIGWSCNYVLGGSVYTVLKKIDP